MVSEVLGLISAVLGLISEVLGLVSVLGIKLMMSDTLKQQDHTAPHFILQLAQYC
jgi:hypothetical protein